MNEEIQVTCPQSGSNVPVCNHYLQLFQGLWGYHLFDYKYSLSSNVWVFFPQLHQEPSSMHLAQVWCHPVIIFLWAPPDANPLIYSAVQPTFVHLENKTQSTWLNVLLKQTCHIYSSVALLVQYQKKKKKKLSQLEMNDARYWSPPCFISDPHPSFQKCDL